jgi:uncharacterized membrane protein
VVAVPKMGYEGERRKRRTMKAPRGAHLPLTSLPCTYGWHWVSSFGLAVLSAGCASVFGWQEGKPYPPDAGDDAFHAPPDADALPDRVEPDVDSSSEDIHDVGARHDAQDGTDGSTYRDEGTDSPSDGRGRYCSPNPCQNGGTCSEANGSYRCDCTGKGYAGTNCELPRFQPLAFMLDVNVFQGALVSADGLTVVGSATNYNNINATFRWTLESGLEDFTSIVGANLAGVSRDGSVLVGTVVSSTPSQAYRWTIDTGRIGLGAPPGFTDCSGIQVSADGSTIVGVCSPNIKSVAVRWRVSAGAPIVIDVLPTPVGATNAQALNVNADGSLIVGEVTVAGAVHPTRWTVKTGSSTTMEDLGALPNSGSSPIARGISANGVVVVGDDTVNAFRWTQASGIQMLPPPSQTAPNTAVGAVGANADGSIAVGYLIPKSGGSANDVVVWDLSGAHRLLDLLLAAGVSPSILQGWNLGSPGSVSADGKVIAGAGTNAVGQGEAWIARLP